MRPDTPDRITTITQLHYQPGSGEPPAGFDSRSSHHRPQAGEEPYARRLDVGADWQPLDLGWLAGACGVLVLENQVGQGRRRATPEERAGWDKQIVEVAFGARVGGPVAAVRIRPGVACLLEPVDAGQLLVRCAAGVAKLRVVALPGAAE